MTRGIVKDFAKMDGFGVNTFVWVNGKGGTFLRQISFYRAKAFDIIDRKEGKRLAGQDPDIAVRTLTGGSLWATRSAMNSRYRS